jgi:hypothetical protein
MNFFVPTLAAAQAKLEDMAKEAAEAPLASLTRARNLVVRARAPLGRAARVRLQREDILKEVKMAMAMTDTIMVVRAPESQAKAHPQNLATARLENQARDHLEAPSPAMVVTAMDTSMMDHTEGEAFENSINTMFLWQKCAAL